LAVADDRSVILARRARLIATAIATAGIAACARDAHPEPCLSTVAIPEADAGSADDTTDAEPPGRERPIDEPLVPEQEPQICLSVEPF
jgi:hypothetical protein